MMDRDGSGRQFANWDGGVDRGGHRPYQGAMERRHQILIAAGRLLCERGPGKTTMAAIARTAGVAVGSVYLEFRGKAEVLRALSAAWYAEVLAAMRAAAEAVPAAERLRAVLQARLDAFLGQARQGSHAPGLMACYCEAVESAWQRFLVEQRAIVADALRDGAEAGALVPDAAEQVDVVLRACATLAPPHLCGTDDAVRAEAARLFDLLLNGLRPR